ncbi:MAG: hypothetical protein JW788_00315, partial [Candidatus Omnitrophica bacterium]|nr:hypothetical protein [Candidatus Omnitrophota bacterium]
MNFIVGVSAYLLNYRILKSNFTVISCITFFILYFSQIILSEIFLGAIGLLYLKNLFILNLSVLAVILMLSKNRISTHSFSAIGRKLIEALKNKSLLLPVSVILGFGLVKVFINLANPPFGWDDLNYHFTFPVEWIKHADLENPITVFDEPGPSYYPINGSLFFLWLMFPLKNVFLADVGQLPFFILGFLAVFALGRRLGLSRENSCLSACLFTLIPNYFKQLQIAYVDVMVSALFLSSLLYLFLLDEDFSFASSLGYGLSLGLLIGTKTVALPYSLFLIFPFVFIAYKKKAKLALVITVSVLVAATGGYSYIKNFIDTANPLYPMKISLFGKVIFPGVMVADTFRAHFRPEDYSLYKLLFGEGLGAQTLLFILPALFLSLPVIFLKRRRDADFKLLYLCLLPWFVYLAFRYVIPLANTRYLYPLLGMGIVLGFYVYSALGLPRKFIRFTAIISVVASLAELAKRAELVSAVIVSALLFILLPVLIKYIRVRASFFGALTAVFIALFLCLSLLERYYVKHEYSGYPRMVKYSGFWPDAACAWDWLNSHTQGDNISYAGRPVPFPLYGTNFKNNVYY